MESSVPRSVGGLEGLVSVLDQPPYQRPGGRGAGDSGSTPGTATAPLSSHSSAHSSGGEASVKHTPVVILLDFLQWTHLGLWVIIWWLLSPPHIHQLTSLPPLFPDSFPVGCSVRRATCVKCVKVNFQSTENKKAVNPFFSRSEGLKSVSQCPCPPEPSVTP